MGLHSFFLSLAKMNYYFLSTFFFSAGVVLCTFDDDLLLQKNSNCPTGWIPAESVDMGCLLFAGERRTWLDASLYCRTAARTEDGEALDTYMAEILSYEQMVFVRDNLMLLEEGRWMWSKSQDYVGEYIWGGSHPEDDLASPQSYYADDGPVNEQYNFICQYKQF